MAETRENLQEGPQEGCREIASSSLVQPTGSQEIEHIETGICVEDENTNIEHKVELEQWCRDQKSWQELQPRSVQARCSSAVWATVKRSPLMLEQSSLVFDQLSG